ncbi:hypothetical protein MPTK1_5g19420 [Marchantia polymorpha subsp. ruderalis]|uniref:cyclin-dependent kinase n=2 Tax=Marchantia polymorpha TaxID=3197 RepID=A0AAF6BK21_MARPO|nr:hypothetical protein MARPO_0073s0002 [Marchantia polymorpha]BBN12355.1 hypothetical protein Mp_5g19420 [Marchantia polymorpha subsp. ruderalis]|eukprot:PTQ35122.1 hypothetical protein MARPO_0073s0002 [Marchantia polymorpha]
MRCVLDCDCTDLQRLLKSGDKVALLVAAVIFPFARVMDGVIAGGFLKEKYHKVEKVGEGRFGVVYKALNTRTKELVAMKRIRGEMLPAKSGMPSFVMRELSALQGLKHSNVVPLYDVFYRENQLYLIFEYMDCDLAGYMKTHFNYLTPLEIKLFMYQILLGISYCHQHNVMHRDLKPQNLLIDKSTLKLKIADFGLSRHYHFPANKNTLKAFSHEVVSLWYRPPEILLGTTDYSTRIDIWSAGCIFAEMALGRPLFQAMSEIEQIMKIFYIMGTPNELSWPGVNSLTDFRPNFPQWRGQRLEVEVTRFDPDAIDLLYRMLNMDPNFRITAKEALNHEYFHDLNFADFEHPHEDTEENDDLSGDENNEVSDNEDRRLAATKKHAFP